MTTTTSAITPVKRQMPAMTTAEASAVAERLDQVKFLMQVVHNMQDKLLIEKVDYGVIPGTGGKPTLLLPGMEKLMRALNAVPDFILTFVIRDYDKGLFHFEYECRLKDVDTGRDIPGGRGIGMCTSHESAFRWRWVPEERVSALLDKSSLERRSGMLKELKFAIDKGELEGKYGKSPEYWDRWRAAIDDKSARQLPKDQWMKSKDDKPLETWGMGGWEYRVPNPDIADQINTIMKRAKKRSLGDAVKGGAGVSEYFTADVEDFYSGQDQWIIEGTALNLLPAGEKAEQPQASGPVISAPVITTPVAPAKPAAPAAPAKLAEQPKPAPAPTQPAPWYQDLEGMALLVSKARAAGYIEDKQGEKDLLKLLGLSDWTGFATRGDAANALKAAADLLKAQMNTSKPAPKPSYDPTEHTCTIESAIYDGERIYIQTKKHGRMTIWSRETLATAAGEDFADTWHIRTWQGTKSEPTTYNFDPLEISYVIDGKYPKMVNAKPVDKNDFDAYVTGSHEPVMELAAKEEPIPF